MVIYNARYEKDCGYVRRITSPSPTSSSLLLLLFVLRLFVYTLYARGRTWVAGHVTRWSRFEMGGFRYLDIQANKRVISQYSPHWPGHTFASIDACNDRCSLTCTLIYDIILQFIFVNCSVFSFEYYSALLYFYFLIILDTILIIIIFYRKIFVYKYP